MTFYYVHHGAGFAVTVEQPDEVHAKNNLHVRCREEGWPVDGWSLELKPWGSPAAVTTVTIPAGNDSSFPTVNPRRGEEGHESS